MLRRAVLCAAAVTATACGGSAAPTLVPTTSQVPSTAGPQVPNELIELRLADEAPPDAPAMVLATNDGVVRWQAETGPQVVIDEPVHRAVDDGSGGIVGLTVDDQLLASLRWWPADGEEVLLRAQGGLTLHDATVRNGSPAVVIAYSPIDSEQPTQVLDVLDLATASSRTVRAVGDDTTGMVDAAAWGDGFAVTRVEDTCADVVTFDDAGESTNDLLLPGRVCRDGPAAYGPLGMADDGTTVAVTALTDGVEPSLLVTTSGAEEAAEYPMGEWTDVVTDVDASARFVAVTTGTSTLLIDLDEATIADLGVPALAVQLLPA